MPFKFQDDISKYSSNAFSLSSFVLKNPQYPNPRTFLNFPHFLFGKLLQIDIKLFIIELYISLGKYEIVVLLSTNPL